MRNVLIINRYILHLGGIENYVCSLIPIMLDAGVRVIWIRQKNKAVGMSFENVLSDKRIEQIFVHNPNIQWFRCDSIKLDKDDKVVVLSFNPSSMAKSLSLVKEYKGYHITPFYYVPDTTGVQYFRDIFFPGFWGKYVKFKISKILESWEEHGLIRFFSKLQINSLVDYYGIKINNPDDKLLKSISTYPPFQEESVKDRALNRSKEFNLITVGRFDFPHKSYILGLIRAFARLKPSIPQLRLLIIGYGPHENKVHEEIAKLPCEYTNDIELLGEVSPNELRHYFNIAHLNVSVAGAVGDGASNSVISIPARNYCDGECEVYGLEYDPTIVVSTKPGEIVDKYILEVYNMDNNMFLEEARRIHNLFYRPSEPWYVFDTLKLSDNLFRVNGSDILFFKTIEYSRKLLTIFHYIINRFLLFRKQSLSEIMAIEKCPWYVIITALGTLLLLIAVLLVLIISFVCNI